MHVAISLIHYHEAIQRVTMTCGMNIRLQDGVMNAFKKAANAREQIALVGRIDHDLNAFANRA